MQNSTDNCIAPTVLVTTSQHRPHRKHRSSTVAFMPGAAGCVYPAVAPKTSCITLFIKKLLP
jgi:hypothetical protein